MAVKTGNPNIVVAAAAELPRLSLADALLVLLVFARAGAPQTEAAAVRWTALYLTEIRPTPRAREAHLVLSAACALAGPSAAAGREALHSLATQQRLDEYAGRSTSLSRPSPNVSGQGGAQEP
jgi:hypothetical protein